MKKIVLLFLVLLLSISTNFSASIALSIDSVTRNSVPTNANLRATSVQTTEGWTNAATTPTSFIMSDGNGHTITLAAPTNTVTASYTKVPANTAYSGVSGYTKSGTVMTETPITEVYEFALSDETTDITTGTAKVTWRAPFAMTITNVRASLSTASSSGLPTVDINESGSTILSTKLTIDANEKTSTTAATAAVISDSSIADDAEITFDITVSGTGAKGLKVKMFFTR